MHAPSLATQPVAESPTNTFNFPAIDLNTFLGFYAELVGRTILRPANLPAPLVTLKTQTPLTRTEALQAFDTVLAMNGISMINVGEKFVKAVSQQQAFQEAAQFSKLSASQLPESGQYLIHMVQLKYVRPSEVLPVLQPFGKVPNGILAIEGSQMLVIRDYAENVKRILEMIEQIDIAVLPEFVSEVIAIKYALASEISSALSSLSSGGAATSVGGGAATTGTRTTSRTGFGSRVGGYGTTPGMPGAPGTTTTPQPTTTAQPSFSDRLRSIIQRASSPGEIQIFGTLKIIADERTNSLLVFASREDMKTIKEIIAKLDTIQPQVLIEALIVEVDLNSGMDYGVSWLKRPDTTGNWTGAGAIQNNPNFRDPADLGGALATNMFDPGLSWWGKYSGKYAFDVALRASATDSRTKLLSRPHVVTTHANAANLFVGETRPYPTGSSYGGVYGSYNQIQQLPIGIELNVMPLINADGLVVMDIQQSIASVGAEIDIANVGKVPSTIERRANAKIAVQSGDTIILGGFISSDRSHTKQGVPILKDIPLLGYLFRSDSRTETRREMLVLIRPTVLPTPAAAFAEAKRRQDDMPLLRNAEEEELQRDEQLRRREDSAVGRDWTSGELPQGRKSGRVFMDVEPKP